MLTFFLCIAWIGVASYAVAMLITIVGMLESDLVECEDFISDMRISSVQEVRAHSINGVQLKFCCYKIDFISKKKFFN